MQLCQKNKQLNPKVEKDLNRHFSKDIQMANKHRKRCLPSLLREMQMKATMRCHHTPILKNRNDSNAGEHAETLDHSHITARDVNGTTLDNSLTVS